MNIHSNLILVASRRSPQFTQSNQQIIIVASMQFYSWKTSMVLSEAFWWELYPQSPETYRSRSVEASQQYFVSCRAVEEVAWTLIEDHFSSSTSRGVLVAEARCSYLVTVVCKQDAIFLHNDVISMLRLYFCVRHATRMRFDMFLCRFYAWMGIPILIHRL